MTPVSCSFNPVFTAIDILLPDHNIDHDNFLKYKSVADLASCDKKRNPIQAESMSETSGMVTIPKDAYWDVLFGTLKAPCAGKVYLCLGIQSYETSGKFDFAVNGKRVFQTLNSAWKSLHGTYGNCPIAFSVHKGENLVAWHFLHTNMPTKIAWQFLTEEEYGNLQLTAENVENPSEDRTLTMERINFAVNSMRADIFNDFDRRRDIPADELRTIYRKYPILKMYDTALDKILEELPNTEPPKDGIVAWHLYNMGYVFKTKEHCFAVDIHHRRAELLEPYLDFILVTHNHDDHYNMALLHEMALNGKHVISNFYPAKGYARFPRDWKFGESLRVKTEVGDHNIALREFMNIYRIVYKSGYIRTVIYDSGDCCNHTQLNPTGHVDCHICHPRVGMDEVGAVDRIHPRQVWFSHLWEMGHCIPSPWRPVTQYDVKQDVDRLEEELKSPTKPVIPLWGEKLYLKH